MTDKIEQQLDIFINESTERFQLEDVISYVSQKTKCDPEEISKTIDLFLDDHELLFVTNIDGDTFYVPRRIFFQDAIFPIIPTPLEITDGILFPGHRFIPFYNSAVFPSELKITPKNGKNRIKTRQVQYPIETISGFHLLLGGEEMLDYFIADNPQNVKVISKGTVSAGIILSVFDLKSFYKKHSFKSGDILVMKVKDWNHGHFSLEYLSAKGKNKSSVNAETWSRLFEKSLENIISEYGNYLDIHEQLAQTFSQGDPKLLNNTSINIECFYENSENIDISILNGQATLCLKDNDESDDDISECPEGVMLSRGKTSSLDEILEDLNCPLKSIEVEAFMRDELYKGGNSCQSVLDRCFVNQNPEFKDDAQEVFFLNYVEDMWENIIEGNIGFFDNEKGEIRSRILELVDDRIQWFQQLHQNKIKIDLLPKDKISSLSKCTDHLTQMLVMLNSDEKLSIDFEIDQVMELIEDFGEAQKELINSINTGLES